MEGLPDGKTVRWSDCNIETARWKGIQTERLSDGKTTRWKDTKVDRLPDGKTMDYQREETSTRWKDYQMEM